MKRLSRTERFHNQTDTSESKKENRYFVKWWKTKDMFSRPLFKINYCDIEIDKTTGNYILIEKSKEFLMNDVDDYDEMLLHFNNEFTNTFETRKFTGKTKNHVVAQLINSYWCLPFNVSDFETRKDISVLFSYDEQINLYVKSAQLNFNVGLPEIIIFQKEQLIYRDDVIKKLKSIYKNIYVESEKDIFDGSEKIVLRYNR